MIPPQPSPAAIPSPGWRDRLLATFRRRHWRGFLSLQKLLKLYGARPELQVRSRYGSQFLLVPGHSVDDRVLEEGFYESEVLEAVRPVLKPGAVLWVIGANFGLHAITAKWLHPQATVVAFEPSPAMGARIIENADRNGVGIDLHAYALGDRAGTARFFAQATGNPGMSTLHPVAGFSYDHCLCVAVQTAAEVIARGLAPAPNALIVDVEGAELEVFRGFGPHLAAIDVIVFEAANEFLTQREPAELDALLRGAGFTCRILERCEDTAHALSNFSATRR